jgi:hypothetical protein
MANPTEPPHVAITVSCPECPEEKKKQVVHVRVTGAAQAAQVSPQWVRCLNCGQEFDTMLPGPIIDGPFPAGTVGRKQTKKKRSPSPD